MLWWSFAYSWLFTEFSLYCNHRDCMVVPFYSDFFFACCMPQWHLGLKFQQYMPKIQICMIWYDVIWYNMIWYGMKSFKFSILRLHGWKNAQTEMIWSIKCFCVHIFYKISGVTVTDCCDQNSVSYNPKVCHPRCFRTIIQSI